MFGSAGTGSHFFPVDISAIEQGLHELAPRSSLYSRRPSSPQDEQLGEPSTPENFPGSQASHIQDPRELN
jgi:hypothetical protein